MTNEQKISEILKRRVYFDAHFPKLAHGERRDIKLSNSCPACGYLGIIKRIYWDICAFCFWEDDGQDNHDANACFGGPNYDYTLTEYRLETFDFFEEMKTNKENPNELEKIIGEKLSALDFYINKNQCDKQFILDKTQEIAGLFDKLRNIEGSSKINWHFLE